MNKLCLIGLALGFASGLHAQSPPAAKQTPPPLPPPPWVKKTPAFSQWLIAYSAGPPGAKPATSPAPVVDGTAKKSVVVTKTPGILLETTARQNGAVIRHYYAPGMFLTQIGNSPNWISSRGADPVDFHGTDYSSSEFAGFDWITEKNYVGVQELSKRPCLMFRDKVVTMDSRQLSDVRNSIEVSRREWRLRQEKKARMPNPGAAAADAPADPEPASFDENNYKKEVMAFIDLETGMPAILTYKTPSGTTETRTYTLLPPPEAPLVLPPEAQAIVQQNQQRLKRLTAPAAVP